MQRVVHVAFSSSRFRHDLTPSAVGLYVPVTDGGALMRQPDQPRPFFLTAPTAFPVWFPMRDFFVP